MVKKPVREHGDAHMTTRVLVRDIMNSPVVTASPDDSLRDIARKMKEEKIAFKRVDADVLDKLITKEETATHQLTEEESKKIKEILEG